MFFLVGAGLSSAHLTREALDALSRADAVFADAYTSAPVDGWPAFERAIKKPVLLLSRAGVEEKAPQWLLAAAEKNVALLVGGNPLSATTHVRLLEWCKERRIAFRVLPGVSVFNYRAWTGLDEYRFGRTITIVRPDASYAPESFFDQLEINYVNGLHSLCLLDIRLDEGYFMRASEGLARLCEIAKKRGAGFLLDATVVFLSRLGDANQEIKAGRASRMLGVECAGFPQSLVVCAPLGEIERAHVGALCGMP